MTSGRFYALRRYQFMGCEGSTLYVAVGLSVRGRPLGTKERQEFIRAVFTAVEAADRGFYFRGEGEGYSDHGAEPSYVLVTPAPAPERLELIRARLRYLATRFRQDAVVCALLEPTTVNPVSVVGPIVRAA